MQARVEKWIYFMLALLAQLSELVWFEWLVQIYYFEIRGLQGCQNKMSLVNFQTID